METHTHVLIAADDSDVVRRRYHDDEDAINHAGYCWTHTGIAYHVYRIVGVSLVWITTAG